MGQPTSLSCLVCVVVFVFLWPKTLGSNGDRSLQFKQCFDTCLKGNCSASTDRLPHKSFSDWVTHWECGDQCQYECMWAIVNLWIDHGLPVPQFYGKAGILTWFWSAIFHARDVPFTEKMDYFCAFGCVLLSFYCCLARTLLAKHFTPRFLVTLAIPFIAFYAYHVCYLGLVKFDYGYNMRANVAVGLINSFAWLLWSFYHYKVHKEAYVMYCVVAVGATMLFLTFELLDFPPIMWTFDAHSLWHLGTAPLPILWTKFIEEDWRFLEMTGKKGL